MAEPAEIDWDELTATLEHEFANELFHCNDKYELQFLKKLLQSKMPYLSENRINYAVEQCCKMLPAPRTIKQVTDALKIFFS